MSGQRWVWITAALVLAAVGGIFWLRNYLVVDSCLDHGGRWKYEQNRCEGGSAPP